MELIRIFMYLCGVLVVSRTTESCQPPPPRIEYRDRIVEKIVVSPACLKIHSKVCNEFKGSCKECLDACLAGLYDYCLMRETQSRRRRSTDELQGGAIPLASIYGPAELLAFIPEILRRYDSNGDNMLSDEEVRKFLNEKPEGVMLEIADRNKDGEVSFAELVKVTQGIRNKHPLASLVQAFNAVDDDADGALVREELFKAFQSCREEYL